MTRLPLTDQYVRKLAVDILARPEFIGARPHSDDAVAHLRFIFDSIRQQLALLRDSAPLLFWTIVGAIVLVGAGLAVHLVWTLNRALSASEPDAPKLAKAALPDIVADARLLASNGNYLEAAHRVMLGTFYALAQHSVLNLRPDRPNRWIRAAIRESALAAPLSHEIDSLVERTERRWFGTRENAPDVYFEWLALFERLSGELK
jgi:hypothetical protein